jgi:hypothetical protein
MPNTGICLPSVMNEEENGDAMKSIFLLEILLFLEWWLLLGGGRSGQLLEALGFLAFSRRAPMSLLHRGKIE